MREIRSIDCSGPVRQRARVVAPEGNPALVPPFTDALLLHTHFYKDVPLVAVESGGRVRGWQADPLAHGPEFGVRMRADDETGACYLGIGFERGAGAIAPGSRALLTQEVRNPRAGRYVLTAQTSLAGTPEGIAELLDAFSFRLVLFGYEDLKKDPRRVREFASLAFQPARDRVTASFSLTATLKSQDEGAFQLSKGVGIALIVEKGFTGTLELRTEAFLRVHSLDLTFDPRPRNDEVVV